MVFKIALALCAALALCNALPWTYSKLHHESHGIASTARKEPGLGVARTSHQSLGRAQVSSSRERARISAPTAVEETCTTASDASFSIVGGTTTVHICEYSSFGVCVTPRLPPCCETAEFLAGRIPSNSSQVVKVGGVEYTIRFYVPFQSVGGCYSARNDASGNSAPICQPDCAPLCTPIPSNACEEGILEDTVCEDGICQCREGFTGDGCCDCLLEEGFYRPSPGVCLPCDCCVSGTEGRVTCDSTGLCNCEAGFTGPKCCTDRCQCCREGAIENSNDCDAAGVCECLPGFIDDKCCNPCDCCEDNTVGNSEECDADGKCACQDGFFGDKCCDPCNCCPLGTESGTDTCDASGNCGPCNDGFFGDKCCDTCTCCPEGTVDGLDVCNADQMCECRAGYSGDGCCDNICNCCEPNTISQTNDCDPETGDCICDGLFRDNKCCDECDCCDVDGVTLQCDALGACECGPGFVDDRCCEPCNCCTGGVVDSTKDCDANGKCECDDGFFGDKCCDTCPCCEANTLTGTNVCDVNGICDCLPGFSGDGCCVDECNCCTNGTVGGSNECNADGECTCATGFTGDKCCTECNCCTSGTVGGRNECNEDGICSCANGFIGDQCCTPTVACGDDTDLYLLIDTTRSYRNHDLCLQTYTLMEIVAALNIGTGKDDSLVGNILYPAPGPTQNTNASFLNELGASDANDCSEITGKLEGLQIDIFRSILEFGYQAIYPSRGQRTLPQNAINLLADALEKRPLTDRRIAGILLTDGEHHDTGLEAARSRLPSQLDLIAAGFYDPGGSADRDLLVKDLTVIAGSPGNIIINESIPALADSIIRLLIRKGIICESDGNATLARIADNSFEDAQEYCRCLQNQYSGINRCSPLPSRPQCSARTFAQAIHGKVKNEELLEEEILAAVEEVLRHHGN